MIITIVVVYDM